MSEAPSSFDRFEVIRTLGKGGMGTVFLARDRRIGRQVAVKVLNADGISSDDLRARFVREARSAGAIRHQNVATVYEVDETPDGQPFIVMEYCEGETLAQRMRRRPIDVGEFLGIARQIATGLDAAHSQGVVHRDMKAANVILEPTGLVKILDFGLARLLRREMPEEKPSFESTSGHFFGTLHYLAPELARGRQADIRSDLFSVGVVLYQMASGHLPFNGDTALQTLQKIRDEEPEPFTAIDPAFPLSATRVIAKLLQKDPEARFQSARDLLADLDAIETPTVRSSATRSSLGRTIPQPRWTRLLFLILAFAVGGLAVFVLRQRADSRPSLADNEPPKPPGPIRSLAVLPLENLANNQKDDFLSVSLADALVTRLQKTPTLQVRPTSAVLAFRGQRLDAKSAGAKLQVDGVLEGHFLAAGDLVRVTLQLTDARTGYSVWADSIDGKRADLLKLIDDVTALTAGALERKLGVAQPSRAVSEPRSSNPRAYEQYLRARALTGSFTPADFNAQIGALKKAIELDTSFAAAYANLAIAISLGTARGQIREPDALQKAEWYARQAVRLDPNLPDSHLALGSVFVRLPGRFRESVRANLAALRLDDIDPQALWVMATYFVSAGDLDKLRCVAERLVRIDPASSEARIRGYWYINAVDPDGALENAKAALESKDTELPGHDIRGVAFVLQGKLDLAEKEAAAATALVPGHYLGKSLRAMIAAARGDRAGCEAAIAGFADEGQRNHWAALRISQCYAKLGDREKALRWLARAAELGNHSWYALIKHPWYQPLQADPEFQKIIAPIKADIDDVHDDVLGVYQLICK